MALVSYDSSDSDEDKEEIKKEVNKDDKKIDINEDKISSTKEDELNEQSNEPFISKSDEDQSNDQLENDLKSNDFLKLPHPSTIDKSKLIGSNLKTGKDKVKVKIFLPSYKADEDEYNEENDNEREFKRFKYSSSKGSGLKSLLPPPKNQSSSTKSTSFVPNVLKKKTESKKLSNELTKSSSAIEDEDESVNFFSFDQDNVKLNANDLNLNIMPVISNKFETDLIKNRYADLSIRPTNSSNSTQPNSSSQTVETDYQIERKLKYEIEKKFGAEISDGVKIQDVNIVNHLTENLDYIKSVSEERQQNIRDPLPSSIAKRKHQITYLAYQAKQNEVKLKNDWAQGKINRDQARSKYGF